MAKLADAPDLGSGGAILRGSSPLPGSPSQTGLSLHGIIELSQKAVFRKIPTGFSSGRRLNKSAREFLRERFELIEIDRYVYGRVVVVVVVVFSTTTGLVSTTLRTIIRSPSRT